MEEDPRDASTGLPPGRREQRTSLRFETRGRIAGHLIGSNQPVHLINLGLGGFAAAAAQPVAAGPHIVRLTTADQRATLLEARRVYCRPWNAAADSRFLAGFEFIRPPQHTDLAIKNILQQVTELRLGDG